MKEFSQQLKSLRKQANLTQEQFAQKLNVHMQTVSKWERGMTEPDVSLLGEIARLFGVSLEKLLGLEEPTEVFDGNFDVSRMCKMLAELRKNANVSQEEVATKLGIAPDSLSRWERGISCPDIHSLVALAQFYDVPLSKLYFGISQQEITESPTTLKRRKKLTWRWIVAGSLAVVLVVALVVAYSLGAFGNVKHTVVVDGVTYNVSQNDWFTLPTPTKAGYEFSHYVDESGNTITFPCKITKKCSLTAVFVPVDYTIDYWLNGGHFENSPQTTFNVESGAITLQTPQKANCTFLGWYLASDYNGDAITTLQSTAGNKQLYAKWSDNTFTIKYLLDGGIIQATNPTTVTAAEQIVLQNPVRQGYNFLGWYCNDVKYEFVGGKNAQNLTLTAKWQQTDVIYAITYNLNGGTLEGQNPTQVGAGEVHKLNNPQKTGYNFVGWYDNPQGNGNAYSNLYGVAKNTTLYAIFEAKTYLVQYHYDGVYQGTATNPNHVRFDQSVTLLPVYKYGHTFDGWYTQESGGTKVEIICADNILQITHLYARFSPLTYDITLKGNGGEFALDGNNYSTKTVTVAFTDTFVLPTCAKGGYVFEGWQSDDGTVYTQIDATNIQNLTLTAQFRESDIKYNISYELNDGTLEIPNPTTVLYGQGIILNSPTRQGYNFLGWYDEPNGNGKKYSATPTDRQTDLILYAIWQEIKVSGDYKNFGYTKGVSSVEITSYNGPTGENIDLVIPSVIDGLPVTSVGIVSNPDVIEAVRFNSITIPEGIVTIADYGFKLCYVKQPITIPSTVKTIGEYAFHNGEIHGINFADNSQLTTIEPYAFCGTRLLTQVHLPSSVRKIDNYAFSRAFCYGIHLNDGLQIIGNYAFDLNHSIYPIDNPIVVPSTVSYIGVSAGNLRLLHDQETADELFGVGTHACITPTTLTLTGLDEDIVLTGNSFDLPTPQKEGYTFVGWKDADGFVSNNYFTTTPQTLTAHFEKITPTDGREVSRLAVISNNVETTLTLQPNNALYYFVPDVDNACQITVSYLILPTTNSVDKDYGFIYYVAPDGTQQTVYDGSQVNYQVGGYFVVQSDKLPEPFTATIKLSVMPQI